MTNVSFNREKPGSVIKKLSNGDKVGVKIVKDRVVMLTETLFVSEMGDYTGVSLRMTTEEARRLHEDLGKMIEKLETELANANPGVPGEN